MNTKETQKLNIELPFDKCFQCSLKNLSKRYEGLAKNVSWGKWDDHIDMIFILDKGTDYDTIVGRDIELLSEIINNVGIKNFFITSATLCRQSEGNPPTNTEIDCCSNNLNTIIKTIININKKSKNKPPKIVVLGKVAISAFTREKSILKATLDSLRNQVFTLEIEEENIKLFITTSPGMFYHIEGASSDQLKRKFENDILFFYNHQDENNFEDDSSYILIENMEQFNFMIADLKSSVRFAYDIETTGKNYITMKTYEKKKRKSKKTGIEKIEISEGWRKDLIIGISFSNERKVGVYLPLWIKGKSIHEYNISLFNKLDYGNNLSSEDFYFWLGKNNESEVIQQIKELLEDPKIEKVGQNLKFDNQFLITQLDIHPTNIVVDTMLSSYLKDENTPNSLEHLADVFYTDLRGYKQKLYTQLRKENRENENYSDLSLNDIWIYGAKDADATLRLSYDLINLMEKEKEESKLTNNDSEVNSKYLHDTLYIPMQELYTKAEIRGIKFDSAYANKLAIKLQDECNIFDEECFNTFEKKINLGSPKQLKELIYDQLGWPILKTKNKKEVNFENASTDKDTLKRLLNYFELRNKDGKFNGEIEFLSSLLDYKNKIKAISTYLNGSAMLNRLDENDFVHTSFKLIGTSSGRLSSSPNIQNLPRDKRFRGILTAYGDYLLYGCDLSQAELRIMAEYANDKVMIDWFAKGIDIHWEATKDIFYHSQNITYDPSDPLMKKYRKFMKSGNFGKLYGAITNTVYTKILEKLQRGEEKPTWDMIDKHGEWFFSTFYRIAEYLKEQEEYILTYGYVDSKFGRRRRVPDAFSKNKKLRAEAVRSAINAVIQGTASDVAQFAAIRINKYLIENNLKSYFISSCHDEIIFYIHKNEYELLKDKIPELMCKKDSPVDRIKIKIESEGTLYNYHWGWSENDIEEKILKMTHE